MLFLLLLGSTYFTYNTEYQNLKDYPWSHCHKSEFSIIDGSKKYNVNYLYCSHNLAISKDFIDAKIREASNVAFEYMDSLNLNRVECQSLESLEVYDIEMSYLNNRSVFNKWEAASSDKVSIWALYDPRNNESGVASIMLTDHGDWNELILAHELSHYWYDRFCLGNQYGNQVEPFALSFEEYYKTR